MRYLDLVIEILALINNILELIFDFGAVGEILRGKCCYFPL
ncbi:Uncharacterised protein [Pasteurella multocida]|nr:Uncharacterised protein [Pasteurella multocida]